MNSGTLVGSLIFAAVLVVLIAAVFQLMMRGWRRRGQRQAALIGTLPGVPDTIGSAIVATRGMYEGCTLAPHWHERVAVGDLGYRSKAVLTRYPEGIMVQRIGADPIWIPQESITAIRTERGLMGSGAGKVAAGDGILVIRWRPPSGTEIDTGFRGNDRCEYVGWLEEAR
jgi:hypothetical protein